MSGLTKIEHTAGCVSVSFEAYAGTTTSWEVQVRAQAGNEEQVLILGTDIAVDRLITALTKVKEARKALLR